jgi:hypothetical protein
MIEASQSSRLFFDQKPVSSRDCALSYSPREFNSPTRSTVPLLDALGQGALSTILEPLLTRSGMATTAGLDFHFEYRVLPPEGKGNASHTDLMVIDSGPPRRALAIEAKWTEPRYNLISTWLAKGTSAENRKTVLNGWLETIGRHTGTQVDPQNCGDLVYQMVHRAASAVLASRAGGQAAMAYLIFQSRGNTFKDESRLDVYRAELKQLRLIIESPENFPFFLFSIPIRPTAAFEKISSLPKGSAVTGGHVRSALLDVGEPLFEFGDGQLEIF